jgi:hypothetical protein
MTTVLMAEPSALAASEKVLASAAIPPARPLRLPPLRPPDAWPVTAALLICLGVVAGLLAGPVTVEPARPPDCLCED